MGDSVSAKQAAKESNEGRRLENGRVLYGTTKEHCESMIAYSLKHSKCSLLFSQFLRCRGFILGGGGGRS
jgi:hypothetical protein